MCVCVCLCVDLTLTRWCWVEQPSKDFDVLAEDFNKPLLIVLTTALFVGTYLARAAVRRKQLNASWA